MKCGKCGAEIAEGNKFCVNCGWQVAGETAQVQPQVQPSAAAGNESLGKVKQFFAALTQKAGMTYLLVGVAALLVLVIGALNFSSVENMARKTFSSPEKYYQWVEKKGMEDAASSAAAFYANYLLENLKVYDTGREGELSVELGEAGKDMLSLAGLAGVDLSWLDKASVSYSEYVKDDVSQVQLGLGLEKQLLSLEAIMDMKEGALYLAVPEISKTYIGLESDLLEEAGYDTEEVSLTEMLEFMKKLCEKFPEEKLAKELLNKYMEIAISCIDDVDRTKGKTLTAKKVSQSCTMLEVEINGETLESMAEAVTEELAEDKKIRKIIEEIAEELIAQEIPGIEDYDSEEIYDMFVELCEEMNQSARYLADMDFEMQMSVYVDGKGNIRGRKLEIEDGSEAVTLEVAFPHDGSKFGFKAEAGVMGGNVPYGSAPSISISGSGKDNDGKISGDFSVDYNGTSLVECTVKKFDVDALKKAELKGEFTFKAGSVINRLTDLQSALSMISDMELRLDTQISASAVKFDAALAQEKDEWGSVTFSMNRKSGKKASIPSDKKTIFVEDISDFEDWWDTVELENIIDELDALEVPSQFVKMLERLEDLDGDEVMDWVF